MRECGECVACCVYLRIDEFDKSGMDPCTHLFGYSSFKLYSGGGCSIYHDSRPKCCIEYKCSWLFGHGEDEDRPDKSLILFDRTKHIDNCLEAKPLKGGQESSPSGEDLITRMSKSVGMPAVVLSFKERRVIRIAGVPE